MEWVLRGIPLVGRILLALIFLRGGINKIGALDGTVAMMASHGVPFANLLVFGAIIVELGAGLMLVLGCQARLAGLILFVYTLTLALIFHAYWTMPAAARGVEAAAFFGHLSMMGGMLYVAAFGAGALSVDEGWQGAPVASRDENLRRGWHRAG
jgi:putative oxidoreductase